MLAIHWWRIPSTRLSPRWLVGRNLVRAQTEALHVDPSPAPALSDRQPWGNRQGTQAPAGRKRGKRLGRVKDHPRPIRQGSSEARQGGTRQGGTRQTGQTGARLRLMCDTVASLDELQGLMPQAHAL